jgi:hypothetical protein
VTVPDSASLRLSNAMTLEAWVYPTALGGAWRTAIMKERGSDLSYALYASDNGNHAAGFLYAGGSRNATSPSTLPLNTWTHLAATYDRTTLRLYVNGTQVATRASTSAISSSTGALRLGGNGVWGEFLEGRLDEVRVYSRALSAAEVASDMTTPVGAPVTTATPSSLGFNDAVDADPMPPKTIDVGGTQAFTVADDAPWLSVTPSSGTAPATLSAKVDKSGLAAGTYTATITITPASGSPVTVPVSLKVSAPPRLGAQPSSLSFSYTAGAAAPAAKVFDVRNDGGGSLVFSASEDAAWMSITPTGGSAPRNVSVTVSPAGLAPGTYTADVTLTAAGVANSPLLVPVTLTVSGPPNLTASPSSMSFSTVQSTPATPQNLVIGTDDGGTPDYTVSSDQPWLYIQTDLGAAEGPGVKVYALEQGLDAGTYTGTITVTAPGVANSPLEVPVTFTVDPAPPKLEFAGGTSFLRFSENADGIMATTLPIKLWNSGGGTLDFTVSEDVPWLSLTPDSGTAPRSVNTPATVMATVDTDGLAVGTYTGSITVTPSYGAPETVGVELIVKAPPILRASPTSLSYAAALGGAAPASQVIRVVNDGYGTFRWSASADAAWVSLTQTGQNPFNQLKVAVDPTGLAPGTYTSTITVTATSNGEPVAGSPQTATVTLTVTAPDLTVAPASLSFAGTAGGAAPASKTLTVSNGGQPYTASDDAAWLSTSQSGDTVTASVDPAGLAAGTYNGTVTITSPGSPGSPKAVPVTLVLSPAAPSGLVAAYGFEESSPTAVTDASGTGNAGTISGATRTASGRFGGALSFDGVNDLVTIPDANSLDLTSELTMEAWVYPTASGSQWRTVLMKQRTGGLSYALYSNDDGNRPQAFSRTGSGELGTRGTATLPLNTWSHLAATYSGSTMRLYVNGVQVATRSVGAGLTTGTLPLTLGGNSVWGEWFAGRIDEVRIYNRALTAAEVQGDMTRAVSG